jgi:hypothetical protein
MAVPWILKLLGRYGVFKVKQLVTIAAAAFVFAFGLAAQDKKPEWKDRAEYDLFDAAQKDANATTRLATLDKWKSGYAQSDYANVRQDMYLITYQQLNQGRQAFDMSLEVLKTRPNDVRSLSAIVGYIYTFMPPQPADLDTAEKTAKHLLADLDAIYAPANKPANLDDAAWAKAKADMGPYAQRTLGWIEVTRKDNPKAEVELTKALQMDGTQAQVTYWLAGSSLAQQQKDPLKQMQSLYHYARAASYDGPNSLPAANRAQILAFFKKAYATYHGSDEGGDQLLAMAKASPLPPADFKIQSKNDILQAKADADAAEAAKDPQMALWRNIKKELTGDNGQAYFDMGLKDAALPKFKGKLISMTPALRPKELVLGIEKADVGEVTLKFENALAGKMEPASELEFECTGNSFAKDPFMLVLNCEKEQLTGWTGKNVGGAAPPPAKKAVPVPKKQ